MNGVVSCVILKYIICKYVMSRYGSKGMKENRTGDGATGARPYKS